MPGIVGRIGAELNQTSQGVLDSMLRCMVHESFFTSGMHRNEELGVVAGWVAHAGSFSDGMPVWNEDRNVWLVLSGEDYADRAEIDRLRVKGHKFDPGNASYLVHLYEELGIEFLNKLNGGFCGLLVDLRERRIILFNDRYGLGRIYFHENQGGFYFASEAKSLLKVLPELRRFDLKGLGEFLSCGCVLQNRTLFSGISLLPPGSAWIFSPGQPVKKQAYFNPDTWENQPTLTGPEYYEKLQAAWKLLLPRYFRGKEQIGLSLTGGVDSRLILAWAPRSAGELPCYTFGGRYRDCADVKISRELAGICRQNHKVIPVGGEFLSEFSSLAEKSVYISDGALDVTGAVDLYVQRKAREIAPVRVTGTNGGEILRRLVAFKPEPACQDFLQPELAHFVQQAAATYAEELKGHRLSFTAFKQAPWYMGSKFVLERSQLTLRMPYFDNDLIALAYQAPVEAERSNDISLRLIAEGNPALGFMGTDRGLSGQTRPVIKSVRHVFEEFLFKAEYAYDSGMPQWLARFDHVFAGLHLERLFLGRHKFAHFRLWYRDELSRYVKEILLDSRTLNRPYLRGARLAEVVKGHLSGNWNYTREIHKLLAIELIQRQLIEQN